jgi:hypothetical protein
MAADRHAGCLLKILGRHQLRHRGFVHEEDPLAFSRQAAIAFHIHMHSLTEILASTGLEAPQRAGSLSRTLQICQNSSFSSDSVVAKPSGYLHYYRPT